MLVAKPALFRAGFVGRETVRLRQAWICFDAENKLHYHYD